MAARATTPLADMVRMVQYMRPHQSKAEELFIRDWLLPLGLKMDSCGNLYKWIGDSPVCYACHIDTVHRHGGVQLVTVDDKKHIKLPVNSASNCLGGDDTCGVWLMREMIKANKPGLYLFHRGEERGCVGSSFIAKNNKKALDGIQAVISLDRRGTQSVITFQRSWRCCSNEFGKSLAAALGMSHELDEGGMYTDSASYTDIVGECTNLSVGYDGEHSSTERIDALYLLELRKRLIALDVTKLVYSRKAGEKDSKYKYTSHWGEGNEFGGGGYYSSHYRGNGGYKGRGVSIDYKKEFRHGYWDEAEKKWVSLTRTEWEIWCKGGEKVVKINGSAQPDDPDYSRSIWTPFESVLLENVSLVARMLEQSWGFDLEMLRDCMKMQREDEIKARTEALAKTEQRLRTVADDHQQLALPPPKSDATGPKISGADPATTPDA